jgi:hypothetical protein
MMRRRHLIVHRADRLDMKVGEKKYAPPLTPDEVNRWVTSTRNFAIRVLSQIRPPEEEAASGSAEAGSKE